MFSSLKNAENSLIILKNLERHHSISKSHHSSTCSRFKGIFVHSDDIFSGKCLHENCINLSYLSIATWITQFGHLWTKLSLKQENCSNLKSCDSWNLWHVDDSWMVHDSWQKGRWMTRVWFTTCDRKQGWWLVHGSRLVTESKVDDSCNLDDSWTLQTFSLWLEKLQSSF